MEVDRTSEISAARSHSPSGSGMHGRALTSHALNMGTTPSNSRRPRSDDGKKFKSHGDDISKLVFAACTGAGGSAARSGRHALLASVPTSSYSACVVTTLHEAMGNGTEKVRRGPARHVTSLSSRMRGVASCPDELLSPNCKPISGWHQPLSPWWRFCSSLS